MRVVGILLLASCCFSLTSFSQTAPAPSKQKALDLDHFDAKTVDSSVDACTDFYKYSCNKWIEKNPVPADEVFWGS
jgi:putative endopeptidase